MKRVSIGIRVTKTDLLKKVEIAETAIKSLRDAVRELEQFENGLTERIGTEEHDTKTESATFIYINKAIDEEAIREPLAEIRELIKPLKEATKRLDKAIITELTKKTP